MRLPQGFSATQLPLLFAHRGIQTEFPENSMSAFTACRENDIPGIELDVQLSADGKVVVFHDETLDRVSNSTGKVCDQTWDQLKTIDIGSKFNPVFSNERIPLLADVLDAFGDEIYFDIEIKNKHSHDSGLSLAVANVIRAVKPKAPLIISSFNPLELNRFKKLEPQIATAAIYCQDKELPWYLRSGLGKHIGRANGYKPEYTIAPIRLTKSRVSGSWVIPWTVNSTAAASALLQKGAIGLISDDPRPLVQTACDFLAH